MPIESDSLGEDTDIGVYTLKINICTGVESAITLEDKGNNRYEGLYPCERRGKYHIAVHAEDDTGEKAEPRGKTIITGSTIFLPLVFG